MAAIDERRAQFQRYKEDVKRRGKPFHPFAMFHDTVMSLVVVSVIVGLACVWYYTSGSHDPADCGGKHGHSCLLGPRWAEKADPGTTNFVPRPDWYFYFLFYLLRIFKWPDSVILGTVGIPTILLIIAFLLPFMDRRRERRLLRRPVADVELGICASTAGVEVLATELYGNARLSRDETLARLLERAHGGNVTVYEPNDWKAPYASGSAKVDAYVICPCSMGTLGTIASGAMDNLIHRAASVALKEGRTLVLMPRETPLSTIHLRNMLELRQAGAEIPFLAPGFFHRAQTRGPPLGL